MINYSQMRSNLTTWCEIMSSVKPQRRLFMEEKPNTIIILDACRYDFFKETNWLKGNLQPCWSLGGKTPDFFRKMNEQLDMGDYFYLTANPRAYSKVNFFDWELLDDKDPRESTKEIKEYSSKHKKIFIHLVPPHLPWLGEKGSKYMDEMYGEGGQSPEGGCWEDYLYPKVPDFKECYRENIEVGLRAVEKCLDFLNNKTIITSDHGELLGEHGSYGHFFGDPDLLRKKELRTVPWFKIDR